MPYEAPAGYFEGLGTHMVAGIRAAESDDSGVKIPALSTPLEAPAGYFENLPGAVLGQVRPQPVALPARRKVAFLRPLRYAAAALALVAAGVGIWQVAQPADPILAVVAVSDISAEDIEAFSEETGEPIAPASGSAPADVAGAIAALSPDDIAAWESATGEQVSEPNDMP